MAKSGVTMQWGGLDKALIKAAKALSDKRALLESCGEALVSGTLIRFEEEKDPKGKDWEPSLRSMPTEDKKTAVRRDAKGRILKGSGKKIKGSKGGKTLTDTARLRNSIDSAVAGDTVLVGSNVVYSRIHQMGGMAGRGHKVTIPARPYLGISKEDWREIEDTISDFISGAFK
jgi:phage virion morphogenesis protein